MMGRLRTAAFRLVLLLAVALFPAASRPVSASCPCSIWDGSAVPVQSDAGDEQAIEVGVRFRSAIPGSITGVRFYKSLLNTGTHVGNLWAADGTRLATATFSEETESGWQEVSFETPVPVATGVTYTASYHTDAGHFAADPGELSSGFDIGPLHILGSGEDGLGNGVFVYGSGDVFPSESGDGTNYWVDVILSVAAPTVTGISPSKAAANTTITITGNALSGASSVAFNGVSATFAVLSATQITAIVPSAVTTGPVSVTTPGGVGTGPIFTVQPKIDSLDPTNGPVGTSVTIHGSGLGGTRKVTFYPKVAAQFTIVDSQTVIATAPEAAQSGTIRVSTPAGTAVGPVFTVTTGDPLPGDYTCTRVLGFSQTNQWYTEFERIVPGAKWEAATPGGGNIGEWANPDSFAWGVSIGSPCVQGPPDRVLLTIGIRGDGQLDDMDSLILQAIDTIRLKIPSVQLIILQPVVGGPGHAYCYRPSSTRPVFSSFYHPLVDDAIARIASGDVVAGASPEVETCSQYSDNTGHLTTEGKTAVASSLGQFYLDFPPTVP